MLPRSFRISCLGPVLFCAATLLGCDPGFPTSLPGEAIEREGFIAVMVELRAAAAESSRGTVDPETRDAILERAQLSEDDLRQFVEIHGRNIPLMSELWIEVETRLAERLGIALPVEAGFSDGGPLPPGSLP